MNRREVAAIVVLLLVILFLAAWYPARSHADVPAVAGREALIFEPIRPSVVLPTVGSPVAPRSAGPLSGQAIPALHPIPVTVTLKVPAVPTPAPSATAGVGVHGDVTGIASWYAYIPGQAAAGPALRVGNWRGRLVTVTANGVSISVRLTDFMVADRLIDLSSVDFARLAPLSQGLQEVTISWQP